MESHERGYPTLLGVAGQPVGGLVVAPGAVAGDLWLTDGTRAVLDRTVVIGAAPAVLTPAPNRAEPTVDARYSRQTLLYGRVGQRILGEVKVAVVGAGGVGMLLVQYLARLGVGHIVVVDPDRVDPSNLPRLPETTRLDAMAWARGVSRPDWLRRLGRRLAKPKVQVARRIAQRANREAVVDAVVGDVADDVTAQLLVDCDFIFLAADTMLARDVVNQLSYQYLIPTLQVGSKAVIDAATGDVRDVYAAVRSLGARPGCLRCNGLVDLQRLGEEALGDADQVKAQRYVNDPEVPAPSVITLNALGAAWAANTFMQYMVGISGLPDDFQVLRAMPLSPRQHPVTSQEPASDAACHVCGAAQYSAFGRGTTRELPTRARAKAPRAVRRARGAASTTTTRSGPKVPVPTDS
jgi:hypothetical protein